MRSWPGRVLSALSALVASGPLAAEGPAIRWQVIDFPPYHIVSGPERGEGLRDRYMASLADALPGFSHQFEPSSVSRQLALMAARQPVCSASMLRTPEREAIAQFARRPFGLQLPVTLVARKGHPALKALPRKEDGTVSLREVLANGQFSVGLLASRRYGVDIDPIIDDARRGKLATVKEFSEQEDASLLVSMIGPLTKGRADLTIAYAVEVEHLRRRHPELGEFEYLPLSEAARLLPLYVACSRHPDTRRLMAALDAQRSPDRAAQQMAFDYLALLPASERARYQRLESGAR